MKLKGIYHPSNLLTGLLCILVLLLVGMLFNVYATQNVDSKEKTRDAIRITDIDVIHQAIRDYYSSNNRYPACLYKSDCSASLEGTGSMQTVAKDPLTSLEYSYAAFGKGTSCVGYHLGASLERSGSQALITGADALKRPASDLCTGSKPDFSGLSYAPGGQLCNDEMGVPAPSNSPKTETCYDLAHEAMTPGSNGN